MRITETPDAENEEDFDNAYDSYENENENDNENSDENTDEKLQYVQSAVEICMIQEESGEDSEGRL